MFKLPENKKRFERYVNFEFYKLFISSCRFSFVFERYVNFEFYKLGYQGWEQMGSLRDM